jgi:predicted ATPase
MIRKLTIENFKSIQSLTLEPGRINVFIGENGGGKSNILEAIALTAAAIQDKLDNEFLTSRGIRVTEPRFMRAAFAPEETQEKQIGLTLEEEAIVYRCTLESQETGTVSRWVNTAPHHMEPTDKVKEQLRQMLQAMLEDQEFWRLVPPLRGDDQHEADRAPRIARALEKIMETARDWPSSGSLLAEMMQAPNFLIYAPENSALRVFQAEGQILPLGIKGEGLFAHLKALAASEHRDKLEEIIDKLTLIEWFERFELPEDLAPGERSIRIRDHYLAEGALFDQRSANEGFLFLLFYFTLLVSPDAPRFFAIDNVDTSLNPKLCSALVRELADLARKHDKQVILTTHNPAILDGLDLHDDEQRLFVVSRNQHGHTRARRVSPPQPVHGELPMKLSEAFLGGYIGGLPKNF